MYHKHLGLKGKAPHILLEKACLGPDQGGNIPWHNEIKC